MSLGLSFLIPLLMRSKPSINIIAAVTGAGQVRAAARWLLAEGLVSILECLFCLFLSALQ